VEQRGCDRSIFPWADSAGNRRSGWLTNIWSSPSNPAGNIAILRSKFQFTATHGSPCSSSYRSCPGRCCRARRPGRTHPACRRSGVRRVREGAERVSPMSVPFA